MNIEKLNNWTPEADHHLKEVTGYEHDYIVDDVNSGKSELFTINNDTFMVTTLYDYELVICCLVGENAEELAKAVYQAAKEKGVKNIRFHTQRKGLQRMLSKYGFVCDGLYYIFRCEVTH